MGRGHRARRAPGKRTDSPWGQAFRACSGQECSGPGIAAVSPPHNCLRPELATPGDWTPPPWEPSLGDAVGPTPHQRASRTTAPGSERSWRSFSSSWRTRPRGLEPHSLAHAGPHGGRRGNTHHVQTHHSVYVGAWLTPQVGKGAPQQGCSHTRPQHQPPPPREIPASQVSPGTCVLREWAFWPRLATCSRMALGGTTARASHWEGGLQTSQLRSGTLESKPHPLTRRAPTGLLPRLPGG